MKTKDFKLRSLPLYNLICVGLFVYCLGLVYLQSSAQKIECVIMKLTKISPLRITGYIQYSVYSDPTVTGVIYRDCSTYQISSLKKRVRLSMREHHLDKSHSSEDIAINHKMLLLAVFCTFVLWPR